MLSIIYFIYLFIKKPDLPTNKGILCEIRIIIRECWVLCYDMGVIDRLELTYTVELCKPSPRRLI